jgi:ankyrin repeat protein
MTPESARGGEGDESVRLAHPRSRVAAAASASSRGGGTPGSWNLGVAHSAANKKDQRDYVDALFAQYPHLMEAAEADDRKKVQELMDAVYLPAPDASTAKIRDAQLRAAALAAARAGGAKSLRLLLDRGADLGLFDEVVGSDPEERLRCTMGIECAGRGRAEVLDVLLSEDVGVSTECRDPRNGMTALMAAARFGHAACIAVLVDRGADVDARSEYGSGAMGGGSTAAMMAAENGHAGALNALRAAGADVNLTREVDGKTAMQLHREKVTAEMKKLSNMGYVQGSSIGNYATEI